uniref:ATP-dependent DNA helicase n=1 Tax=Rhizophagus irregularis (strain DAOM 181602 / DAOM 197198 / MUCL 43194) TaxID=747089 RepID=U9SI74_RHIID
MRLFNATNNSTEQAEFAKWLLEVGEGRYFVERRILAPTNEYVNSIKTIIMNQFPAGEAFEYLSADTVEEADDQTRVSLLFNC